MNIALIVAIVGLIVYLLVEHPKSQEVARIAFWVGLLAYLLK